MLAKLIFEKDINIQLYIKEVAPYHIKVEVRKNNQPMFCETNRLIHN